MSHGSISCYWQWPSIPAWRRWSTPAPWRSSSSKWISCGLFLDYKWIICGYIYILIVTMVISVISGLNNSHGYSHVIAMCNLNCALRKAMVSVFNMGGIHDLTWSRNHPRYGGFLKSWGYPQSSSIYRWIFPCKPSSYWVPQEWKPPYGMIQFTTHRWSCSKRFALKGMINQWQKLRMFHQNLWSYFRYLIFPKLKVQ